MKRPAFVLAALAILATSACKQTTPPPTASSTPAPPPEKPVAVAPAGDAGAPDARLGMMERYAIWKAKKAAEEKAFAEERARVLNFDKGKLAKHLALVGFEQKTRQALDEAASKLNGKFDGADQLKKLATSQQKAIQTQIENVRALDPEGGNSAITGDHDVILQLLSNDYPMAILSFFQGNTKPLVEARDVLDKREARIQTWLKEIQASEDKAGEKGEAKAGAKAGEKGEAKAGEKGEAKAK
jgi:hypothetical protein